MFTNHRVIFFEGYAVTGVDLIFGGYICVTCARSGTQLDYRTFIASHQLSAYLSAVAAHLRDNALNTTLVNGFDGFCAQTKLDPSIFTW